MPSIWITPLTFDLHGHLKVSLAILAATVLPIPLATGEIGVIQALTEAAKSECINKIKGQHRCPVFWQNVKPANQAGCQEPI